VARVAARGALVDREAQDSDKTSEAEHHRDEEHRVHS
jgi:hypothetical protein